MQKSCSPQQGVDTIEYFWKQVIIEGIIFLELIIVLVDTFDCESFLSASVVVSHFHDD